MADLVFNNPLDIIALPISSIWLQDAAADPIDGDSITIKHTHLLSESNLSIDPVIRTDSLGRERTIYYKFILKLYISSENEQLIMRVNNLATSGQIRCYINFGSTGAYSHEGTKTISLFENNQRYASLSYRTESIPGMIRRVATISANLQYYPII